MGFVIFSVMGVYFFISLVVVIGATKYAKKNKLSVKKWGWGAAFVMYMIPFWDWIPTVVAHKYYCEKEAGFWVYKTLDQWKAENPGVMEGLVEEEGAPSTKQGDMDNYTVTYFLNQRFNWVVKHNGRFLFNRWRHEQEAVDAKTDEVLARYINFSTSQERQQAGWNGWKFWLANRNCSGGRANRYSADQLIEDISLLTKGVTK